MTGQLGLVGTAVTRPVFEGIGPLGKAIFYAVAAVSTAVFAWGVWHRVRKYRIGRAAGRGPDDPGWLSAAGCAPSARGHRWREATARPVWRTSSSSGASLVAFLATVILTIDTDVVRNVSRLIAGHEDSFFHGTFFIVYTFAVDTLGFAFLLALVYMAVRRGVRRPWRLGYSRAGTPAGGYSRKAMVEGDWLFLGLLLAILVTAYVLTGLRILGQHMPWFTVFSPFGQGLRRGLFRPRHDGGPGCQRPHRLVVGARRPRA